MLTARGASGEGLTWVSFLVVLQVPPMPASQARAVIEEELGGLPLEEVFDWIDLNEPLGSASIAQVRVPCSSTMHQWSWLIWCFNRDL